MWTCELAGRGIGRKDSGKLAEGSLQMYTSLHLQIWWTVLFSNWPLGSVKEIVGSYLGIIRARCRAPVAALRAALAKFWVCDGVIEKLVKVVLGSLTI